MYYVTTMTVKRVGAREANQQFSALLAAAERDGQTIVITRRGKAVARLIPEPDGEERRASEQLADLLERYARPMGGKPFSRDDLYDRGELKSP
jgi:prevent-host-death family protein